MSSEDEAGLSRRVFVHRLAFFGGGSVVLGSACDEKKTAPAATAPAPKPAAAPLTTTHQTFTDEEFATLRAVVDTVLPKDEDVGGVEAGVPEYVDHVLTTPQLAKLKADFVPGLAALDRRCRRMHQVPYAQATPEQRAEVLTIFKDSPEKSGEAKWYELLIVLCLEGFLGDPSYGGNRGEAGWKLVGFDLVGRGTEGAPKPGYDGVDTLKGLTCGAGRGC